MIYGCMRCSTTQCKNQPAWLDVMCFFNISFLRHNLSGRFQTVIYMSGRHSYCSVVIFTALGTSHTARTHVFSTTTASQISQTRSCLLFELTLYSIMRSRPCTCFSRWEERPRWCFPNDLPEGEGTPCSCSHLRVGHYHPSLYMSGFRDYAGC